MRMAIPGFIIGEPKDWLCRFSQGSAERLVTNHALARFRGQPHTGAQAGSNCMSGNEGDSCTCYALCIFLLSRYFDSSRHCSQIAEPFSCPETPLKNDSNA